MLSLDRDDKLDESNGEFIYELNQTNYKECSPVLRTSLYNFKQLFRCPRSDFRLAKNVLTGICYQLQHQAKNYCPCTYELNF